MVHNWRQMIFFMSSFSQIRQIFLHGRSGQNVNGTVSKLVTWEPVSYAGRCHCCHKYWISTSGDGFCRGVLGSTWLTFRLGKIFLQMKVPAQNTLSIGEGSLQNTDFFYKNPSVIHKDERMCRKHIWSKFYDLVLFWYYFRDQVSAFKYIFKSAW